MTFCKSSFDKFLNSIPSFYYFPTLCMKEFDIMITPSKDNIEILLTSAILFTEIN